ncbi:hypothetical protein O3P69_018636 [Scylla paramamosain]|uniref:Condensin-2 complex subunit D3 n=1 Tax=Scylla paramamosain TaxID=85552 RepID=A0AAW0T2A2_SCYPA
MADAAGKMQQVLELLSKFSLNSLDSEWTKSVIDADFTEVGDLPSNFEEHHFSTNLSGLFSAVNNSFRHWVDLLPNLTDDNHRMSTSTLTAEDDDDRLHTRFWTELSDDLKKLMTLLFYYCYRGQRYDAREAEREFGIQAASLYFLVLCVPGSNAFRVFHPVMYRKCMETMRLATKLQVGAASPKKGRHSTTGRASQRRHQEDQMNTEAEEEEESEATMLTPSEATKLVRSLNVLLHDFLRLTVRFSLKHSPESLDETISILIEVSCSETNNAAGIFVERHGPATTTALAYNSYCSLQSLCCTIHGQKKKIVLLIMKHILHNILMVPRGLADLSGRSLNVIREHSQIFVKYILMQVKEEAYDGVYILIQHLCLQVPDKAEFRQKAAQSVVEILRFLPTHLYVRLIKWFFKFSHNEKAGHRLFMLEVISKMLGEVERSAEGSQENLEEVVRPRRLSTDTEYQENENSDEEQVEGENSFCAVPVDHPVEIPHDRKLLSHKFLLSIIFSRCRDSAASVRSKALTLLAECTLSTNRTIMLAMQQIFVNNKSLMFTTPHITSNNINLESPVQENEEVEEEELKFPNASLVVSMLRRRALDDKVTVRKSALQVLENLMKLHNDMLTHQNLAVSFHGCHVTLVQM